MKKLLSVTCLLLACVAVRADDTKPAAVAKSAAAGKAAPVVDTKPADARPNGVSAASAYASRPKSTFTATANDHNPFWPIGWAKMEAVATTDDAAPVNPRVEDFAVSTIMLNEPPMAVINGKDMAEGEIAALSVNGHQIMVQLMAVQDGRVILRWQNQNLIVPIHRQEILSAADTQKPVAALR